MKTYDSLIRVSKMNGRAETDDSTMTINDQANANRQAVRDVGGRIGKTFKAHGPVRLHRPRVPAVADRRRTNPPRRERRDRRRVRRPPRPQLAQGRTVLRQPRSGRRRAAHLRHARCRLPHAGRARDDRHARRRLRDGLHRQAHAWQPHRPADRRQRRARTACRTATGATRSTAARPTRRDTQRPSSPTSTPRRPSSGSTSCAPGASRGPGSPTRSTLRASPPRKASSGRCRRSPRSSANEVYLGVVVLGDRRHEGAHKPLVTPTQVAGCTDHGDDHAQRDG